MPLFVFMDVTDLYNRHAQAWAGARLQSLFHERTWLEKFCTLASMGEPVLDLGCGAGAPVAAYLAERGYAVTGVDASPAMIGLFREGLPGQEALVGDMRTLSLGRTFGGILAWDSLFHLSFDDQRRMFPIFRAHAAAGAALMFNTGPAHGEAIGMLEGEPLYHASLDPAEYRRLLHGSGFHVVAMAPEDPACGGRTVWLARRR